MGPYGLMADLFTTVLINREAPVRRNRATNNMFCSSSLAGQVKRSGTLLVLSRSFPSRGQFEVDSITVPIQSRSVHKHVYMHITIDLGKACAAAMRGTE